MPSGLLTRILNVAGTALSLPNVVRLLCSASVPVTVNGSPGAFAASAVAVPSSALWKNAKSPIWPPLSRTTRCSLPAGQVASGWAESW